VILYDGIKTIQNWVFPFSSNKEQNVFLKHKKTGVFEKNKTGGLFFLKNNKFFSTLVAQQLSMQECIKWGLFRH